MTVTVCIPAYRAEAFLAQTVESVLVQSYPDLRVIVSIDPADEGSTVSTARVLHRFESDPRLSWHVNSRRLGWAENVNSLLSHIRTPFFAFLPHDDIWAPNYLEILLGKLKSRPEAVVAYADSLRFGASPPVRVAVNLPPDEDRITGLLRFLIQGTEANMWRGVTRTDVLDKVDGFPTDMHKGFVVECEYSLSLFSAGTVIHVPRTLYFKRIYERSVKSASRERMEQAFENLVAGWEEHDRRMTQLLLKALDSIEVTKEQADLCHAAKDAAVMRRYQQFVTKTLEAKHLERIEAALAICDSSIDRLSPEVAANLHLVLQTHLQSLGDSDGAREHAQKACSVSDQSAGAVLAHARELYQKCRLLEALERATEVVKLGQRDEVLLAQNLIGEIYKKLRWTPHETKAFRSYKITKFLRNI